MQRDNVFRFVNINSRTTISYVSCVGRYKDDTLSEVRGLFTAKKVSCKVVPLCLSGICV